METASYDTIGNAYFSLVIHVLPRNFRELLVITSAFHMPRNRSRLRMDLRPGRHSGPPFETVPDIGMDDAALQARRAKEAAAPAGLPGLQHRSVA